MRGIGTLLLILLGGLAAGMAQAGPLRDLGVTELRSSKADRVDQSMSMREAANRAQKKHGGRVLAIDQDGFGGYRVKLLKNGEVRTVHVSPE